MIAKSVVAPMDRIKIMYQVTTAEFRLRDVPKVAWNIIEKEGWQALWKGNLVTMIRVFPYSGIQFMVFDYCKSTILRNRDTPTKTYKDVAGRRTTQKRKAGITPIESLFSGMAAGSTSALFTYPLDLARTQLAVLRGQKRTKFQSTIDTAASAMAGRRKGLGYVWSKSIKQGGIGGLYRGITPTLLGILPYSGIAFTINEQSKRQISHIFHREPSTVEKMICGGLSGLFAQTIAYPLEVTRRRMQTIGIVPTSGSESAAINFMGVSKLKHQADELPNSIELSPESAQERANIAKNLPSANEGLNKTIDASNRMQQQHKPPSMILTMRHLFEEQGVRGFFKGVSMNWIKGPLAFSISFTAFDALQGWAQTETERDEKRQLARGSIQRRLTNNEEI